MDSIDNFKKFNAIYSESISSYYKGNAQQDALQNITAISNRLELLSSNIHEKLSKSISDSKSIIDSTKELIELKNKINNEESVNADDESLYNEKVTFNDKQNNLLVKLKELIDLDGLINLEQKDSSQNAIDASTLTPGTYKEYSFTASNGVTIDYYAYIPSNIEDTEGLPVHLHLWPSRSNGGPDGYYNIHGLPKLLREGSSASGVVICPKLYADEVYDQQHIDALKELSDSYVNTYKCDSNRISVSGQGGGGQAAINFASRYPDYFSKVVSLYSLDTAYNYDEFGLSKSTAEYNLSKNDITLIRCTGGGDNLDARSIKYTDELYNSLKHFKNIDVYDNPHYIYGDDLFSNKFTYEGKTYSNLLEYCFAKEKSEKSNKA